MGLEGIKNMQLESTRHYMIADYLFMTKRYVTSEEIARQVHASVRTVKNDMVYLNDVFCEHGGRIRPEPADGPGPAL